MVEAGVEGLVSFGIAGGLDHRYVAGDLVVADSVLMSDAEWLTCHASWRGRLIDSIKGVSPYQVAPLIGSHVPIASADKKAELHERHGAAAVDMESHAVAAVASQHALPFIAVRAIADPAHRAIPALAIAGLDPQGRTRPWATMTGLLRRPSDLPHLLRLAADTRRALMTLRKVAAHIEPALSSTADG